MTDRSPDGESISPATTYSAKLKLWEARKAEADGQFRRLGNWRLAVGLAAVAIGFYSLLWLLAPLALFLVLVVWHSRIKGRQTNANRAIRFYSAALRRIDGTWPGQGASGDRYRPENHIYADDLDLFGRGSLFELTAQTRTAAGEQMLAYWLLRPANFEEALARQRAVLDLKDRLDLREDLALLGEEAAVTADLAGIEAWAARKPVIFAPVWRFLAPVLAILACLALLGFFGQLLPISVVLAFLLVNTGVYFLLKSRVDAAMGGTAALGRGLGILGLILFRLETEQFQAPQLIALQARLQRGDVSGSKRLAQLRRWVDWQGSSEHMAVRAIRLLALWGPQVAIGLERWRQQYGMDLATWLRGVAELEALCSLGALAFDHPAWSFPTLMPPGPPLLTAELLRHPLLPQSDAVPNNLQLGGERRLLIVSGSNMSGKSTLLRAIGLNAVLAWAGGPVAATHLQVTPVSVGASIRVTDSTLDHRSRFMAEILRLRQIVALAEANEPVLFLLDEILSGTNSHDRRIGAKAVIHKFLQTGSIGVVTTHDLALTELERNLAPQAANVHLEDELVDGALRFDYQLKPGVVTRSNALELMRSVGLAV